MRNPSNARHPLKLVTAAVLLTVLAACSKPTPPSAPVATAATASASSEQRCTGLAGRALEGSNATVADAVFVAGRDGTASHCLAHIAYAASTLRAELHLPGEGWNGNLAFLGGGGFDGVFPIPDQPYYSASARTEGYAIASTNGGYDYPARDLAYFNAAFAHDPKKLDDFTHASEHRALPAVTALVEAFYGTSPKRKYFEGCSMGGHDALILAQHYPADFDGIVARAPAGNVIGLMLQFHRIAQIAQQPEAALTPTQLMAVQTAVLDQCDAADGVRDGLVSNPLACDFNPTTLACPADAKGNDCLSSKQLQLLEAVSTPMHTGDDRWHHPGYAFSGAEADPKGWSEYILAQPALGGRPLQGLFSDGFLRAFVTGDDAFDTAGWKASDWTHQLDRIGTLFQADNPDLGDFHARGGKLILWNGTADTSVSARDTARYFETVRTSLGAEKAQKTTELFLAPGVGHCAGGPGADQIDLLQALSRWVETAEPPSNQQLTHERRDVEGNTVMSRPACAYPAYAHYRGAGDVDDAASFVCQN